MQQLVLLSLALLVIGLIFTVVKWPGGLHMTFSQHAATNRWSKIFYAILFLTALPILMLFFVTWFVPTNKLPVTFLWIAAIAVVFQIACALIPEEGGRKIIIHRILTTISAISLLPLVIIMATSSSLSMLLKFIAWIALLLMTALLSAGLYSKKSYRYALVLQIGYYAAFFIVILATTYL